MGLTLLNAPPPWRGYPNMNAVHGIRLMHRVGGPGLALPRGTPKGKFKPIGTLPPNSFVTQVIAYVKTAYGAGFTVDIGGGPLSDATPQVPTLVFGGAIDLSAIATLPQTLTFGYVTNETPVYARLNGAGDPTTGELDVVITYYWNQKLGRHRCLNRSRKRTRSGRR